MNIPATDSLRHERVGIVEKNGFSMLLQAYVQTEATENRGAYDPVEEMSRPFPYLISTNGKVCIVENMINNAVLSPISDTLVEYAACLYESMEQGSWTDKLDEFDAESFDTEVEREIAKSLMSFSTRDCPQTLFRTVYKSANKILNQEQWDGGKTVLTTNPLRDIEGRERYGFSYIPNVEDVDKFNILRSISEGRTKDGVRYASESLWVRYHIGETVEERPLVVYQNEIAGPCAQSPSIDFGDDGMRVVSSDLVKNLINGNNTDNYFSPVDVPTESRTMGFLNEYVQSG